MKTNRGFEIQHFYDDYGVECMIQESSAAEPHIWLGVAHNSLKVMAKDKPELIDSVLHIAKDHPECNEMGWCTVHLPKEALIENRMHLNRKQAKELAKMLEYFARHGVLKEEKGER